MESERVADRLAVAAAAALVGREQERDQLRAWVMDPDGPSAVFIHGPAGIGKTALVTGTLGGPTTVVVDGREIEPTPATVLAHIGTVLGLGVAAPTLGQVADAIAVGSVGTLVIDSYQRLGVVDGWLRNRLLPSLPARTTTVLVGRNPPNVAWRTAPGWRQLLVDVLLGPLTEAGAAQLVARKGLAGDRAERAQRFGRGHPLALELACEALVRHPDLVVGDAPPAEVVEELVEVLFDDLDPELRDVVEAAAVLRRVTVPALAAVLERDEAAAEQAWVALRDLPFATVRPDGVELQAVVQDVTVTRLELRDPARARDLRRRAAGAAMATVQHAPGWAATADLLHLVQNPVVRSAFIPPAGAQHPVETATATDLPDVLAITERHIGADESARLQCWWHHHPEGLSVSRGPGGGVQAFSMVVEAAAVAPELLRDDPAASAMAADLQARPLRRGGRALLSRRMVTSERGARPCPDLALMIVDLKRTYLEMRPDLLRVYDTAYADGPLAPMLQALGFALVSRGQSVDLWALDMPTGSVDAWIAGHIELETSGAAVASTTDSSRQRVASLSAREREVLAALADGLTNQELADRLFISERTANRHLSNIFTKLGVRNRTAAARIAIEAGLAA
ncbi:MAG TPA: LuxR family transcriptional regulator [Acidimicrobiia bacterium]|jgi:DNA-binding CsgD family transcriptional regulator/ABC-type branched-subunit amino acid transport system ATPase component